MYCLKQESDVQFQRAHIMAVSIVILRSTHLDHRSHTSVIKATLLLVMLPTHVAMMGDGAMEHGRHIAKVRNNKRLKLARIFGRRQIIPFCAQIN